MLKKLYFVGIILITALILIIYVINERDYNKELDKIKRLEEQENRRVAKLNEIRSKTIECPIKELRSPRACYFDSNYSCTWNEEAERCDMK